MKRFFLVVLMVLAVFMLASCATSTATSTTKASSDDDAWWNNPPEDTADMMYVIGEGMAATNKISRSMAEADARNRLALKIEVLVQNVITQYEDNAGEISRTGDNQQALQAYMNVSKQTATRVLYGVTFKKYHTEDDGTVYVLAGLPKESLAQEMKKDQEEFVKNGASEEANRRMTETIDEFFGTPK